MGWELYLAFGLAVLFFTIGFLVGDNVLFRRLTTLYSVSFLLISVGSVLGNSNLVLSSLLNISGYLMFIPIFYINYKLVKSYRSSVNKAYIDPLTGVYNRIFFDEVLSSRVEDYERLNVSYTVFFVDVDDLKHVNDNFGHEAGDKLLSEVGKFLKSSFRMDKDAVVRYGGDEFVIVAETGACVHALNILHRIEANLVSLQNHLNFPISLSIGFACYPEDGKDLKKLIKMADERMYNIKREKKRKTGNVSDLR